jgi:hypothetical protein
MQIFDKDQQHYISKGQTHQKILRTQINEALFNNQFGANYVISGPPGLGKSYEMSCALKNMPNATKFEGNQSFASLVIDIATAAYVSSMARQRSIIVLDDCDVLFHKDNVNATKKMFDDTRKLKYGKIASALRANASDLQKEALDYWSTPDRVGFEVALDNCTFVILTNMHLPTINEVNSAEQSTTKYTRLTDLHAIRRRVEYKEIEMQDNELWGYVANVVLNEKICEKFNPQINEAQKQQILSWCFSNWRRVTERNLSLIEKMTKDMIRYPHDYLDIWANNYL